MKVKRRPFSTQLLISAAFTIVAVTGMLLLSLLLYGQFVNRSERTTRENSEQLLGQAVVSLEDYLRNMRRVSDAMYYAVIKGKDLAFEDLNAEMDILYEANKDKLVSIACYYADTGELVDAYPGSSVKQDARVREQDWFTAASQGMENLHFSVPHVQNLFQDPSGRYYWVISLSRAVDLNKNGVSMHGILLVDMNYSSIVQLLERANSETVGDYVYLMDQNGNLIYHPHLNLINSGAAGENNIKALEYEDQTYEEVFLDSRRLVTLKTVGYTGWKLVRVVPMETFSEGMLGTRYLVILMVAVSLLVVIISNQVITSRITMPLRMLDASVKDWEAGKPEADIYVGGSLEVEHLGRTLRSTLAQSRQLMQDIVVEQEEKRKTELDALQSQINPHFLYNTLDSILWMIQGEKNQEAIFMVKQLGSLFRISLSRGKTIISIDDELKHAEYYINIQKVRYKNDFSVSFDVEDEIRQYCTVKLILQPLLENAIYYGMEYMDDEGEIYIKGSRDGQDIILEISDNGPGMPEDEAALLLTDTERKQSRGSGVGLTNVHKRVRLRFGSEYGLSIDTHPDEGMTVRVRIPAIPFTEENRETLENGKRGAV